MKTKEIFERVDARAMPPLVMREGDVPVWSATCPICKKDNSLCIFDQSGRVTFECINKCAPQEIAAEIERMPTRLETFSAVELMDWNLGSISFVVKDFLHQGLAILTADPKTGKSWLALDLCICVASGQPFLDFETTQGGALYLALEDSKRRLQGRMRKLTAAIGIDPPESFYLATAANPVDQGLPIQIDAHIKTHPDTTLVVIDVLNRVRSTKRKASQTAYEIDSAEFARIKAIADKHNICVLLIHHTRKGKDSSDAFQNISGSNGIIGGVDEGFMLTKENRMDERARLSIISREMGDREILLSFDKDSCRWAHIASAEEDAYTREVEVYNSDPVVKTIKGLLALSPGGIEVTSKDLQENMPAYADLMLKAEAIGRAINRLEADLYNYDKIRHSYSHSGKRKHRFFKVGYVFPFELESS